MAAEGSRQVKGASMMGRPVMHFEIASPNIERASAFYRELFDWEIGEEELDGYRLVRTAEGSIGGGLLRSPEGVFPYVTVYVGVDDLRVTLRRAEELGGKMVVEPMPIPGVGRFAMFQDPDGVMIGIFEED
jgi:predicted enzyme related to lactoylglutathione lyase